MILSRFSMQFRESFTQSGYIFYFWDILLNISIKKSAAAGFPGNSAAAGGCFIRIFTLHRHFSAKCRILTGSIENIVVFLLHAVAREHQFDHLRPEIAFLGAVVSCIGNLMKRNDSPLLIHPRLEGLLPCLFHCFPPPCPAPAAHPAHRNNCRSK